MKSWWSWKLQEMKASKHSYILLAPYMLLFLMFTVIPVVISIILSFTYFNMLEFPRLIGWQNYTRLFLEDDIFLIAVKNTLLFAVITGPISYIACFVFAWIINELTPEMRGVHDADLLCAVHFGQRVFYLADDFLRRPLRYLQRAF